MTRPSSYGWVKDPTYSIRDKRSTAPASSKPLPLIATRPQNRRACIHWPADDWRAILCIDKPPRPTRCKIDLTGPRDFSGTMGRPNKHEAILFYVFRTAFLGVEFANPLAPFPLRQTVVTQKRGRTHTGVSPLLVCLARLTSRFRFPRRFLLHCLEQPQSSRCRPRRSCLRFARSSIPRRRRWE